MPALNFKKQFVPALKAGLAMRAEGRDACAGEKVKTQTIRKRGARAYKVGDTLQIYCGQRTVACEKLGEAVCTEVRQISITPAQRAVSLECRGLLMPLFEDEIERLALADGFNDVNEFFAFFQEECEGRSFAGQLIRW